MYRISVINSQGKIKLNAAALKKTAAKALSFLWCRKVYSTFLTTENRKKLSPKAIFLKEKTKILSVYIVDDAEIRSLNYKYRSVDRPTDVLAFSMSEGSFLKGSEGILGDVVISIETALSQAKLLGRSLSEEMNLYLVHGILHLFGYDDLNKRDKKKMFDMQEVILTSLRARTK